MSEDDAIALVGLLGGGVFLVGAPALIVAVAAFAGTRAPGDGPKPTGGRGLVVALAGHGLGVITLGLALVGVLGAFIAFEGSPHGPALIGAYALVALVVGGFLMAPSLFFVGLAIARGGGQKTRAAVLGVAAWVLVHHFFATVTLVLLYGSDMDPFGLLAAALPTVVGGVHAVAMAWVGLARIGTAAPAA